MVSLIPAKAMGWASACLRKMDAEKAHGLAISGLKTGLVRPPLAPNDARLSISIAGLKFSNPLGLAAGFDKNGDVPDAILRLGFGFCEIGTITPLPQSGNAKPRLFRLPDDQGVINRFGFNSAGHQACLKRLMRRRRKSGIVGINIGSNRDSDDKIGDYVKGVTSFANCASYLTVNISSPNTPGLRNLQAYDEMLRLLDAVYEARQKLRSKTPIFVKIAPDLDEQQIDDIAVVCMKSGINGAIVSNTTLARDMLKNTPDALAQETGGLSGRPLFERSTVVLAKIRQRVSQDFPLIGVGGIDDCQSALEKIRAGADLLQLYSAMVFKGPLLGREIVQAMSTHMSTHSISALSNLRDTTTDEWARRSL